MADTLKKISELTEIAEVSDNHYIPVDDGTITNKITVHNFNASSNETSRTFAYQAKDYAEDSEAWANGTRNGSTIPSTDTAYQKNAKYYATQASESATSATSASLAAQSAQTYAEAAQTAAEGAAAQAESAANTMTGYAAQVAGYVTQAHSEADRAENAANLASGYVTVIEEDVSDVLDAVQTAESAATTATTKAEDAESWAVGKRNGTDVDSSDPAYHNNSKYYSEQAASSATTASGYASDASRYADTAEGYKTTAQNMADAAQVKATESGEHALDSEAWAVGKRSGVDVGSSDETYHNNSKYYAQQSADRASEAATASANATYVADQISTLIGIPQFTVDFTTGELVYTMDNAYDFEINQTTGELEWEVVA